MPPPKNIILVEDNEDDYEAVVRGFKVCQCPCPVTWFKDASEALISLEKEKKSLPIIILLDLNLPGLDGMGFLKKLKVDPSLKSIPVIILTTSSDSEDIKSCYEYGANSYIQKPLNFEQMKVIVRSITDYWFKTCLL